MPIFHRFFFLLILISMPLLAQDEAAEAGGEGGGGFDGIKSIKIKLHEENYLFPAYHNTPNATDATDATDLKYRFSLKLTLAGSGHQSLSFAYSQKSFWQAYAVGRSRPFRETNYNPEIFMRLGGASFFFDMGYEHESNGEIDPISRSWDRAYLTLHLRSTNFKISYQWWKILAEEKHGPGYLERPDTMKKFYGNGELKLTMRLFGVILKTKARYNFDSHYGYVNPMLLFPIGSRLYFALTYSHGYGDSLRDYNNNLETYGAGVLLNP